MDIQGLLMVLGLGVALSVVLATLLAVASRVLHVEEDPR